MQCSCYGGFAPAAVGAGMFFGIAAQYLEGVFPVVAADEGRADEENACDAGGDEVEHVVDAGGGSAEVKVFVILVADHGVHGVGGAVEDGERQAADEEEEKRCDDAVDGVFGYGLDGGARDVALIHAVGIAADDVVDFAPGGGKVRLYELGVDFIAGFGQGFGRHHKAQDHSLNQHIVPPGEIKKRYGEQYAFCQPVADGQHDGGHDEAADEFFGVAAAVAAQQPVQDGDEFSHQRYGMQFRIRVADDGIDQKGQPGRECSK